MNKWIGVGRTTREPDVRYTQANNTTMARVSIAVDRRIPNANGEREVDFIPLVIFGKQAEFVERYIRKGTRVAVSGRIQTGSYTDKEGRKVYTTDVIVEEIEFAESKREQQDQGGASYTPQERPSAAGDGFMDIPDGVEDSGLPFN